MDRSLVVDLPSKKGGAVRVCGWAEAVDHATGGPLLGLRDPTGVVRLVWGDRVDAPGVALQSAVEVVGTVAESSVNPGGHQLVVDELYVLGPALAETPLNSASGLEERLDWRFLDLRSPENRLIFRIQTTLERAMRELWSREGFIEIHSPKLKPTPNQSGSELFTVAYFDRQAYLAQSPQFYKQMAMAAGFERVFEIGPVFRANPMPSPWHDTEFTSVDVEMSWIDSHEDLIRWEEVWLRQVLEAVKEEHGAEMAARFGVEVTLPDLPFPRLDVTAAREIVERTGYSLAHCPGDLDREGERRLSEHVAAEHGHDFVFVSGYPEDVRPFYHMRCQDGAVSTRSFDLIWKGLEVTTGAQREHRYDVLLGQAERRKLSLDLVAHYLDFFRFGCPPHGGFGLGLTRVLMTLLGRSDVREVTYLPRGPHRLHP